MGVFDILPPLALTLVLVKVPMVQMAHNALGMPTLQTPPAEMVVLAALEALVVPAVATMQIPPAALVALAVPEVLAVLPGSVPTSTMHHILLQLLVVCVLLPVLLLGASCLPMNLLMVVEVSALVQFAHSLLVAAAACELELEVGVHVLVLVAYLLVAMAAYELELDVSAACEMLIVAMFETDSVLPVYFLDLAIAANEM